MNQKEISEIRRRFRPDKSSIDRVYGCYVGSNREIISYIDSGFGLMTQEEQEMYLNLLKKSLSGTLGRNLIDIVFETAQVADSEEHRLLQALRESCLEDREARETLYRSIIEALDMGDSNYLILLASDTYDVPYRGKDDAELEDASEYVYRYFVCSICPVKDPGLQLRFDRDENAFHAASTGNVVAPPEVGFLFPTFDDRRANIYNALLYSRTPAQLHQELIDVLFRVEPPMSAPEQRTVFDTALTDALQQECSYDVVQAVHDQIRSRIEEHKESGEPERLDLTIEQVGGILTASGVHADKVEAFKSECEKQYGQRAVLDPNNIVESKKFEVCTPEIRVTASAENSYLIETRVIDGKKYLLIPAENDVTVNGINVNIPG